MTQLIAISLIYRQPSAGPLSEMVGYDADGNAIVRAKSEQIQPGSFFEEPSESEAQWMIDTDAARLPTAKEIEAYKQFGEGLRA